MHEEQVHNFPKVKCASNVNSPANEREREFSHVSLLSIVLSILPFWLRLIFPTLMNFITMPFAIMKWKCLIYISWDYSLCASVCVCVRKTVTISQGDNLKSIHSPLNENYVHIEFSVDAKVARKRIIASNNIFKLSMFEKSSLWWTEFWSKINLLWATLLNALAYVRPIKKWKRFI